MVLGAGLVPRLFRLPDADLMPFQGSGVPGLVPPGFRVGPKPYFPEQGAGVVR